MATRFQGRSMRDGTAMTETLAQRPDRDKVLSLLGGQVGQISFAAPRLTGKLQAGAHVLQQLNFSGSHGEDVPALFLPPRAPDSPAVLYCHAHGARYDIGLSELSEGRPALVRPYLQDLADLGCAVLCLEMPCFGSRQTDESALSKAHLWRGTTLFGQMLAELWAGTDFLSAHPDIDAGRIASLGVSMGGTQSWWLAALDPRLRAAVSLCCFADLSCLISKGLHDRHGQYMTVPGILRHTCTGALAGLAAPTPQLFGVGLQDWSSPKECFDIAQAEVTRAYARAGAADALRFHVEASAGHHETDGMRAAVLRFLTSQICGASGSLA